MIESKQPLVINRLESKSVYDYLVEQNEVGVNELYLIQGDDTDEVVSVNFTTADDTPRFTYTTASGTTRDIVTAQNLKRSLGYSSVASDGQYTSLTLKPSINGIELTGNKTTADLGIVLNYASDAITNKPSINGVTLTGAQTTASLGISYNDLSNRPSIPSTSNVYIVGDTGSALTSVGVASALSNYTEKTRSVTGIGALGGGGTLTNDVEITHNLRPTGLQTSAVKIGADNYGHVCIGGSITAGDVGAIPGTYEVISSAAVCDGSLGSSVILMSESEEFGLLPIPSFGVRHMFYLINTTENALTATVPSAFLDNIFIDGVLTTSPYPIQIPAGESVTCSLICFMAESGDTYGFVTIVK